ncbi:MAG: CRISPR-associated protein Csx14 [Thermoplasmatales archaeon]
MKSALINPMGTSPMVATEMVNYLRNIDDRLRDVILICTDHRTVVAGANAAASAIKDRYPGIRVHMVRLEFPDIHDESSLLSFLSAFIDVTKKERSYDVDTIYLNVSGGRKVQNIVLSLYAGILGIDQVYNVFDPDLENFNARYEEVKSDVIDGFGDSSSVERYREMKPLIESIFYPPLSRLVFLKVGVLQMSQDERIKLKEALSGTDFTDGSIEDYSLKAYRNSGLITYDRTRTYATELGEVILRGLA